MKILVADDHQLIVDDLTDEIMSILPDADCTGLSDTEEIIRICSQQQFDVVFMDIDMPGTNGIKIAKMILEKFPRTNIIYVTGYEQYALDSYETNASTFLVKPVSTRKLKEALENLRFPVSQITDEMIADQSAGSAVIGRKIEKYREERGISRNELSELMGVSVQTVYRWENGERIPDVLTMMRLCRILGISADKLI